MQRTTRFFLISILILTTWMGGAGPAQADGLADHEPGQVVVKLSPDSDATIDDIHLTYGTTEIATLFNHPDVYLLQAPLGTLAIDLVQALSADPRLVYAELNYINENPESGSTDRIYGWGGSDPTEYQGQDATLKLDLEGAHTYSRGAGARLAILDSGAQLDHPELASSLDLLGFDFVDNDPSPAEEANGLDEDGDGRVDEGYGHGTHVAGIAHLVAPEARLMILRVLNSEGRGNDFRTANAILYAAYHGADVINLSLGTLSPSRLLSEAVRKATDGGAMVVAAAGNLNSTEKQYPAAETCAVAVTAVDSRDKKADFANYGDWIGVAAPGENIYSTFPVSGYAWWSGTSMATPFVAGQAALLRSLSPELTPAQVGHWIGGTADSLDPNNPDYRGLLGQGLIDPVASLEALTTGSTLAAERGLLANCQ